MTRLFVLAAALPMVLPGGAAMAGSGSYSGSWRVTLTDTLHVTTNGYQPSPNSTHCLVLTDDGIGGRTHSGFVQVDGQYDGQFQVTGRTILISVGVQGSGDELATWMFVATARDGSIAAHGSFETVQGGEYYVVANAKFTAKGGC